MRNSKLILALIVLFVGAADLRRVRAQVDKPVSMKGADIKGRAPVNRGDSPRFSASPDSDSAV